MRKSLIICSVLILTLFQSSSAESYQGFMVPFLTTPASVRAQALGNAGVTDVGIGSHTINPASLALRGDNGFVSVSLFPTKANLRDSFDEMGFNFYGVSVVIPPSKEENSSNIAIALAFDYYKLNNGSWVGPFQLDNGTWIGPFQVGPSYSGSKEAFDETFSGTFSLAKKGKFHFGFGVTFRYFKSVLLDTYSIKGYLFDSGIILKKSYGGNQLSQLNIAASFWRVTPSIGISVLNIGSNQQYGQWAKEDSPPKTTRIGTSVAIDLVTNNHTRISIVPLFEVEKLQFPDRSFVWHFGGEVGIQELVYLLIGKLNDANNNASQITWGFRLSSGGLSNLIDQSRGTTSNSSNSTLLSHLSLDLSYAKHLNDQQSILSGTNFLSMSATLTF